MAKSKPRQSVPVPRARDSVNATAALPDNCQVVLVLQGGGALGAYQAGVYEGLHEAGIEPDWVIGTSIGAINASLIVGNRPGQRVKRLRTFWQTVALKGLASLWPALPGQPTAWSNFQTMSQGLPGFFTPNHQAWIHPQLPLDEDATGYYHTTALRETLASLVEPERLNAGAPRMTLGAVNVRTGAMRYFDSRDETLELAHILASGALPPAFPPVRVGDEWYWDGGIYSNTPVEAVFDDHPRRNALVFAVQLWHPDGDSPRTMSQVTTRQKDIQYASRVDSHVQRQAQIHQLRHIVRELGKELPAAARARPEIQKMVHYGCGTVMHLVNLVVPRLPGEDYSKDMDFSSSSIQSRWNAGIEDVRSAFAKRAWLQPVDPMQGLVVHEPDLDRPIEKSMD
ncbi:MAG TPA: patatin-like phospholipase family protein [Polaromonas sp.]